MTVLNVLKTASLYLNLRDELDYYFNENNNNLPSSEIQKKFEKMLNALNLVIKEIAVEFKPLYKKEQLNFVDGKASLSNLTENVNKIVCISDNDNFYKFSIVDGYICCNATGEKIVKYSYIPEDVSASDNIMFDENISEKTLAFGVCMEYFYLINVFDEVSMWEDRFYSSLKNCLRNVGRYNMPKRRWL